MNPKWVLDVDAMTDAIIANEEMKERQAYLEGGRRFEGVSDDALRADWVRAFKEWVRIDGFTPNHAMSDLSAELKLRNLEPPIHLVRAEIALAQEEVRRVGPSDPGVMAAIKRWFEEQKRPKH